VRKFLVVLALSLSTTAVAYANPASPPQPNGGSAPGWQLAIDNWLDQRGEQFEDWWYTTWGPKVGLSDPDAGGSGVVAAPEFDPAGMMAALTLLAGGLAVVRGRRAKH
jgi:hypothetical protein